MTPKSSVYGFATTVTLAFGGAAHADVTADSVWNDMKSYFETYGFTVEGTDSVSGQTLTVEDFIVTYDEPDGNGNVTLNYGTVAFTEKSDGSVSVALPPEINVTLSGEEDGADFSIGIVAKQTGMTILATGDDAETTYDFLAPEIALSFSEFVVEGETIPAVLDAVMTGYRGRYVSAMDGVLRKIEGDANLDGLSFDLDMNIPEENTVLDVSGQMADLTANYDVTLPPVFDDVNMAKNLDAGFAFAFDYSYGESSIVVDGKATGDSGRNDEFLIKALVDGADFEFEFNRETLSYAQNGRGLDATISGSDIPLPEVNIAASEYGLSFRMPANASEEPGDVEFGLQLVDLSVSDMVWAMLDPMENLPRDPATLIVGMTGEVKWLADIMDEEVTQQFNGDLPAEIHSATITDLQLSIAGVEAEGEGAFTFDNSDLETFGGMPRPEGSASINVAGVNGLMDSLVAMGVVPEDELMGFRMMMGMFAVAGEEEDTLSSSVEVNSEGHVLVNGQRLR